MKRTSVVKLIALFSVLVTPVGCSPASYVAAESMVGTAIGAAAGSGVGWLFASEVGNTAENIIVNGAIGAGVGLLAGAILHERNLQIAREREVVLREARMLNQNQREIDELRRTVDDASSWGANERRPWDERYQREQSHRPYQGAMGL